MAEPRVVVTGLGVVAANAVTVGEFEAALRAQRSGIRFHQALADAKMACQVGGIPEGVDDIAGRYFAEDERRAMNSNSLFAAIAALDAWTDAGLARPDPKSSEVDFEAGALLGTGIGGMETIAEKLVPKVDAGQTARLGSAIVEQVMASGNSARLAGLLALGNRVSTNSSACTTGTEAVVEAFFRIRAGRASRMLAGGSEGSSKYTWAGFDAMKVLNRSSNAAPQAASRPMSASAAGFVPSCGAGVLLLESLASAERRGARIYAEVLGGHVNCGGQRGGGSMTAPNPDGVRRCIRAALAMARVEPSQLDAINGHLTATFADPHEVLSWQSALDLVPERMPYIQATKSLIGHALGGAGGIECVAAVLQLTRGFLHGSSNCEDLHPRLLPFARSIVQETFSPERLNVIAKASFGFGDVNGCVVFRRLPG